MAYTSYAVNDSFAVKMWSKSLVVAMREYLEIAPLMGKGPNNIIQVKDELAKGPGDTITYGLRARLQGGGIVSSTIAEGNGEALSIYSDQIQINELGHVVGVKSANTIDQQRVPFDLREEGRDALAQWWADRLSVSFFNQVCGVTSVTDTRYTGLNATRAPTTYRWMWAGTPGAITADASLTSSYPFTLNLIDQAVTLARVGDNLQMVRPLIIQGQKKYVMYLHPLQVRDLRTNTSSGQWLDIQKFALSGGVDQKASPIYTGALGEYNGVILRQSQDVPYGVNAATGAAIPTVRRVVLLGQQACGIAWGRQGGNPNRYRWNEELLDHKRKLEVSAWAIWGMNKMQFNSEDYGTVVVSTYAA
jgi:N4-gp56 family major capsid protein